MIGAVVLGGLASSFSDLVARDPAISADLAAAVEVEIASRVPFAPAGAVREALDVAGVDQVQTDALVADFEAAQLTGLRLGLVVAVLVIILGVVVAGRLPDEPLARDPDPDVVLDADPDRDPDRLG